LLSNTLDIIVLVICIANKTLNKGGKKNAQGKLRGGRLVGQGITSPEFLVLNSRGREKKTEPTSTYPPQQNLKKINKKRRNTQSTWAHTKTPKNKRKLHPHNPKHKKTTKLTYSGTDTNQTAPQE